MEKKIYDEKPSVVVLCRIAGQIYTTVNFGIRSHESGYEAFSTTMVGEKTAEEIVSWLVSCGMIEEMQMGEMEEVLTVLKCDDRLSVLKTFMQSSIESYDQSEHVNSFLLGDKRMWLDKATRVGLSNSVNIEKEAGKTETSLWFGGVKYTIPVSVALQMLAALELYALQCYNVTAEHAAQVDAMETEEEVKSFDYTCGYPEKLVFNI